MFKWITKWSSENTFSEFGAVALIGDFPFDLVMGFPHLVSRYANPAPVDFGVFWWDLGIREVSNGQEMALGFK